MADAATTAVKPQEQNTQVSASEAFTQHVLKEFGMSTSGAIQVTDFQRQLIQGYFIQIDRTLKAMEERRLNKNANNRDHKYDDPDPITWKTIDLNALAMDIVHYARLGLDMMQSNHLHAIPYKNNSKLIPGTEFHQYRLNLMLGYNGIAYIAEKYAVEKPQNVTIELVYSNDTFKPVKKTRGVEVESYDFEITSPFDRGDIVGGFGYIEYADPKKNELVIMTLKDILKRKPQKASGEFWGGEKTVWENGTKKTVETEGWFEEMCIKTIKREVYSPKHIPVDPKKVDDAYQYARLQELRMAEAEAQNTIDSESVSEVIDVPLSTPALEAKTAPLDLSAVSENKQEMEPVVTGRAKTSKKAAQEPEF
ncbi:MAG: recombinase RecT [Eubacteriales bacterium]|nr:recombinase RecT [Eubacteriales bacterium]